MPSDVGKRGHRFADHRLILEGIAWRYRVGAPWRDLPRSSGRGRRCGNGITAGRWTAPIKDPRCCAGRLGPTPSSTTDCAAAVVGRLDRAGASARRRRPKPIGPHRGLSRITRIRRRAGRSRPGPLPRRVHHQDPCPDRPPEPGGAAADPGQAGDNPQLVPLLDGYCRRAGPATVAARRPTARRQGLLASSTRAELRRRRDQAHHPRARLTRAPGARQGLSRWPPTRLRRRHLHPAQHRRTRLQPAQAMARYRHPLRQVRLTFLGGVLLAASIIRARTPIQN